MWGLDVMLGQRGGMGASPSLAQAYECRPLPQMYNRPWDSHNHVSGPPSIIMTPNLTLGGRRPTCGSQWGPLIH